MQAGQIVREHFPHTAKHFVIGTLQNLHHRPQLLKPAPVNCCALHQVLFEPLRGPNAELRGGNGSHAVPDGDDHVEVVVRNLARDTAGSLLPNL